MDWTSLLAGGPLQGLLPAPGSPASGAPGAPMNILPQSAQTSPTPVQGQQPGILNQGKNGGDDVAMAQALKMIQQPQPQLPAQPQIQMAKPVGSAAGFDPSKLLAAMRGSPLSA